MLGHRLESSPTWNLLGVWGWEGREGVYVVGWVEKGEVGDLGVGGEDGGQGSAAAGEVGGDGPQA